MLSTCWEDSAYTSCMAFWEFSSGIDIDFKHFMFEKIQISCLFFSWWKGKISYKDSWNAFQSGFHFTAVLVPQCVIETELPLYVLLSRKEWWYFPLNSAGEFNSVGMGLGLGKMRKQTRRDSLFCHWEASNYWECCFFSSGKWGG